MRELLTRRIGPAPVWLYFIVLVIGGVIFLRWRGSKTAKSTAGNINDAPNLTNQPSSLIPYTSDIFVNIQQPTGPATTPNGDRYRAPRPGRTTPIPAPLPNPGQAPAPAPSSPVPAPPPMRQTSITYPVVAGDSLFNLAKKFHTTVSALYQANKAQIEAVARQHGFASSQGGHWIFPSERLVIPQ